MPLLGKGNFIIQGKTYSNTSVATRVNTKNNEKGKTDPRETSTYLVSHHPSFLIPTVYDVTHGMGVHTRALERKQGQTKAVLY
ncbi:hypothetical protein RRG08_054948 [Elysia crispata]|uniref:Uncharacterized protein n=1 Tax=Elysia crispata TaxID=231223 RepID=A0AAE0YXS2_9GAST|nr:hypothetical protein RRG08_054948 [Elysia crispata]